MPRFPLMLLIFLGVPLAEIVLLIQVGGRIGAAVTVGIVIVTAVVGTALVRRQGIAVIARAQQAVAQGRVPARELADGVLILIAGAFLLTPGFLTDTVGFLLLLPPVRSLIRRGMLARLEAQIAARAMAGMGGGPASPTGPRASDTEIIDDE